MTDGNADDQPPTLPLRVCGGLLVLAATALVATVESFYVLLRMGTVRIPVSVALAVLCHPLLTWLMRAATGSRLAMLAPFAAWLAVLSPLGLRRAEADLVIPGNNWVTDALLYGGSLRFVGSIGVLMPPRRERTAGADG